MNKAACVLLMAIVGACTPTFAYTPAVPIFTPPSKEADPLYDSATWERVEKLHVTVNWDHIPLDTALRKLTELIRQVDESHAGIKFWTEPPQGNQVVTVELQGAPLEDVLTYICLQDNLKFRVHRGEVEFYAPQKKVEF